MYHYRRISLSIYVIKFYFFYTMVTKGSFKALFNISSVKFFSVVLLLQFYEIWRNRLSSSAVNYFNFLVVDVVFGFLICAIGYYQVPNSKHPGDQSVRVNKFSRELPHNRTVTSYVEYKIKKTIFSNPPFFISEIFLPAKSHNFFDTISFMVFTRI